MFDFGALPPEINSARMYAGPGSGPMMAAAAAWDGLAAQLEMFAARYSAVVSEVHGEMLVRRIVDRHGRGECAVCGLGDDDGTAGGQAASQSRAAAAAYEAAFAATVPPAVVAANRTLLAMLVATNFFGQNAPAIAATEAAYAEMWAQDAAAMYNYAGSASSAASAHAVQPATADHEFGGAIRAKHRGIPGRRHVHRTFSNHAFAADVRTAATVAEPRFGRVRRTLPRRPPRQAPIVTAFADFNTLTGPLIPGVPIPLLGLSGGSLRHRAPAVGSSGEGSTRDGSTTGQRRVSGANDCAARHFRTRACRRGSSGADRRVVHPAELGNRDAGSKPCR